MKKYLIIYAVLILLFIAYNIISPIADARTSMACNILFGSILFGYMGFMAYVLARKMGKNK